MFAHVSVWVSTSLSSIFMLDLAPLPEEPVVIRLQALGRPVFGELPKACLVSQVSKCKAGLLLQDSTRSELERFITTTKKIFNSFLSSNKSLAFSDSLKKCSTFFSQVYVHPCYPPTSFSGSYDASWAMSSAQRNSVYLVPKATFPMSAASSVQSPTSRHYRSVSAPKSEGSVCAEGTVKPVQPNLLGV